MVRKLLATCAMLLLAGCAAKPRTAPPTVAAAPAPAEPSVFVHHIEWRGQTLGQIARWYTGKFSNWKKLTNPVNPDLEHCCMRLRVGRDVAIPRELLVRTDPLPKPAARKAKPRTRAQSEKGKSGEAAEEPEGQDEGEEPAVISEAPTATANLTSRGEPPPIIAEAPPRKAVASGTVDFKGSPWEVADAVAYPGEENAIDVALSSKPFDRSQFAKDGKIDSFDILHHQMETHASIVTLQIGADGSLDCFVYQLRGGGGSSCGTAQRQALKLTRRTRNAIAGRFSFHEGTESIEARFDLPITREAKRPGSPLRPGGGAPGAAVRAHFDAMRSGDFERLKAVSPPEKRQQMESAKMDESDRKAMLEFLKAAAASDVEILGGTVDGDSALVDYQGTQGGERVKGTAELKQIDGTWYVESETSR